MTDKGLAQEIKDKCEQYWNAHNIADAEIHAVLEFVHIRIEEMMQTKETWYIKARDRIRSNIRNEWPCTCDRSHDYECMICEFLNDEKVWDHGFL